MRYDLNHLSNPADVLLVYEGKFTPETTKSVLQLAERNIDSIKDDAVIKRKVFNVLVECLQNVVKHGEMIENPTTDQVPALMIGREQDHYTIISGNAIAAKNVDNLKSRIDKINKLDKDGLKDMYKVIMRDNTVSEKGGAGLGLIDMARKSGGQLDYGFSDIDKTYSYFSLKTTISRQIK